VRERYDLIIVGAGAAGNAVAKDIEGINALVIEKRSIIGEPAECAGLVSKKSLEILDLDIDDLDFVQNRIYGAYIHSPRGKTYHIGGDKLHAYAIDRAKFDRFMANIAKNRGIEYLLNTKVEEVFKENSRIIVKSTDKEFETNVVIGADGVESMVRKTFFDQEPDEILFGIGAEVEGIDVDPKSVHVFFGKKLTPDFFAWIIPINEKGSKARIGLCMSYPPSKSPKTLLHDLFNYPTTRSFLEDTEITSIIAGRIPLGYMKRSAADNVILIGDSAFQVKPLSGGGIYPIAEASRACVSTLNEAFEKNDFSERRLKKYHDRWSEKLKKEILFGLWIRKRYRNMEDNDIERFLSYLERRDILEIINRYGDIDHPSRLIFPLTKKIPTLISLLPKIAGLFV